MPPNDRSFQVNKSDWKETRFVDRPPAPLEAGDVLLRVDRFAFTANNVTYAVAGDMLDYWGFFPTGTDGWGHIPTMGFGHIVESRCDGLNVGDRFFGFYPMANHHKVRAGKVSEVGFSDVSDHRQGHAAAYTQFANAKQDPFYDADFEDQHMLIRGLFLTSFLADDFLADSQYHGARSVIVTSASSKTAIALAFQLTQRSDVESVGLTSPRNIDFVQSLGLYDRVLPYEEMSSLPAGTSTAVVDMAGSSDLTRQIHEHFGANLVYDCTIGATHWSEAGATADDLPGAAPEFFFAPAQIQKRSQDWGPAELQLRLGKAWRRFRDSTASWLHISRGCGPDKVASTYREILDGRARPSEGHILSLWPQS